MVWVSVTKAEVNMNRVMRCGVSLAFVMTSFLSHPALAGQTLCCQNAQGRNVCGDILPQECYARAYRVINGQGITVRRVDAPLTAEQRAQRELELIRKKKEAEAAYEARRQDEALLAAYASEKDFDTVRDRAIETATVSLQEVQTKLAEAEKLKKKLVDELEFYKKKSPPETLKQQIKANEADLQFIRANLEAREQEIEKIKARYEAERQRYVGLKQGTIPRRPKAPSSVSSGSPGTSEAKVR